MQSCSPSPLLVDALASLPRRGVLPTLSPARQPCSRRRRCSSLAMHHAAHGWGGAQPLELQRKLGSDGGCWSPCSSCCHSHRCKGRWVSLLACPAVRAAIPCPQPACQAEGKLRKQENCKPEDAGSGSVGTDRNPPARSCGTPRAARAELYTRHARQRRCRPRCVSSVPGGRERDGQGELQGQVVPGGKRASTRGRPARK